MENAIELAISRVLRESGAPLRAVDIVRALAAAGTATDKATVNKALYRGGFEKAGAGGTPTWRVRAGAPPAGGARAPEGHFAFQVEGVGYFHLRDGSSREGINALLLAALSLVPGDAAAVLRHDDTEGGRTAAELADGRARVEVFAP